MSNLSSLPSPNELEAYERLVPGSAARVIKLAETRAEQEAWVDRTFAREERLTRLMSYGSALFGIIAPAIAVCTLVWKILDR